MTQTVLITGGTGLVGKELTKSLLKSGHKIKILSRNPSKIEKFEAFSWDPKKGFCDPAAMKDTDVIIHLAGAGVADKRWSSSYKREILDSRVQSAALLFDTLKKSGNTIKSYISASAVGIYGYDRGAEALEENSDTGSGFLADVCEKWEKSADEFNALADNIAKIRIGIVLSEKSGALPQIAKPVKLGFGAPLASGNQLIPWIHVNDLARLFKYVMENSVTGPVNAVAPKPVTNERLTEYIAGIYKKPLWLPKVPGFALSLILGEFAESLKGGLNVKADKIKGAGFEFEYPEVLPALKDLLK